MAALFVLQVEDIEVPAPDGHELAISPGRSRRVAAVFVQEVEAGQQRRNA